MIERSKQDVPQELQSAVAGGAPAIAVVTADAGFFHGVVVESVSEGFDSMKATVLDPGDGELHPTEMHFGRSVRYRNLATFQGTLIRRAV